MSLQGLKERPKWLTRKIISSDKAKFTSVLLRELGINTVCVSAKCPNIVECFENSQATFLILGSRCTRSCSFCAVENGKPYAVDHDEPQRVAEAARRLKLRYAVITSVTRDDLTDGGASAFIETAKALRDALEGVKIEYLIPDFAGNKDSLALAFSGQPDILSHNVETVPRLYKAVREGADYSRSLNVLKLASSNGLIVKSGLMLGLGEKEDEVLSVMKDLRQSGCSILTLGQYLSPGNGRCDVVEFIAPEKFEYYGALASKAGFSSVASGPFVRSSYHAEVLYGKGCSS
ncbi:MAG: lipoyl synthase [Candidatus Omnitrophica bacterium]|nr:lipoyl synthase [Candidatus Omnitrophota bacterium]